MKYVVIYETDDFCEKDVVVEAENKDEARAKAMKKADNISFVCDVIPL